MKLFIDPVTDDGNITIDVAELKRILNKYSDDFVIQIVGGKEICGLKLDGSDNENRFLNFKIEGDF